MGFRETAAGPEPGTSHSPLPLLPFFSESKLPSAYGKVSMRRMGRERRKRGHETEEGGDGETGRG
jgi:hypothetical protein